MPSTPHEELVKFIGAHPTQLQCLLSIARPECPIQLPKLADSTVRSVKPMQYHPDLLFAERKHGYWVALEVQRNIDHANATSWPVLIAMLNHQRKCTGDLVIVTHSRAVAKWIRELSASTGPLGSTSSFAPIVILLNAPIIEQLLASPSPLAGLLAAWSVHHRTNKHAEAIAYRAVAGLLLSNTPVTDGRASHENALRSSAVRAILSFLQPQVAERIFAAMKTEKSERSRNVLELYIDEAVAKGKAKGKAEGKASGKAEGLREALCAVLKTRRLTPSKAASQRINQCHDTTKLQSWLTRAVTATKAADVFLE